MNNFGLIAGNGVLPLEVARAARKRGFKVIAVAHRGETPEELGGFVDEITWIKVGELEKMIGAFKRSGVKQTAMAGGISRARLVDSFAPDARALAMLARIGRFSDDAVLRGVAGEIESEGIEVIDPIPMVDNILAGTGLLAGSAPTTAQLVDLQLAFRVLDALGSFDVGQAAAVRDGVVYAIEAVEGTDPALRRAVALGGKGMVMAKGAKSSQDLRFDRPAIGPATIGLFGEIGVAVIGVQAHTAMILEREITLEHANRLGVTVFGHE